MNLSRLVQQAKRALRKNPSLIEKGGDAVDKATGGKYADKVDKAQDAARRAAGLPQQNRNQQNRNQQNQGQQNPGQQNPGQQNPDQPQPGPQNSGQQREG